MYHPFLKELMTVSYTHLDVYKRQSAFRPVWMKTLIPETCCIKPGVGVPLVGPTGGEFLARSAREVIDFTDNFFQ